MNYFDLLDIQFTTDKRWLNFEIGAGYTYFQIAINGKFITININ